LRERLGQLDRLQHATMFKVIASVIVLAIGIALVTTYIVSRAALDRPPDSSSQPAADAAANATPDKPAAELTPAEREAQEMARQVEHIREINERTIRQIEERQADPTAFAMGVGIGCALLIGVIWIGQGLNALAFLLLLAIVCWPLNLLGALLIDRDIVIWGGRLQDGAKFIGAVGILGFCFVVLMELLRIALAGPWAITAIARNVVNEAVRMKVSLIFIVMLLLTLAAIPGLLDAASPLRYRMQSFLQYGVGGTFWIIAILVLFLSVGSVAFEQRDKIIWQTMTKPVAPWQYIFGKWLGVIGVAAVLLGVSSSGVFLFAEYLRGQPASGEYAPFRTESGRMSEDRFVLENQVMVSRLAVRPSMPALEPKAEEQQLKDRIERIMAAEPGWRPTDENIAAARRAYMDELRTAYLTIEGGNSETYVFRGLSEPAKKNLPITLRYRVDIGANDPRNTYRISFEMPNTMPLVREVPGGQTMTLDISPASIDDKGNLTVVVTNGDLMKRLQNPDPRYWANPDSMSFPPDGIEVYYPIGSYHTNFLRVILVLWIKLAFLSMVSIWAATYLSFSVASLVAFGVFLIAESAGFLSNSLEYFSSTDMKGNIEIWKVLVRAIAVPVATTFKVYADLRPTGNLVDGRLLSWGMVIKSLFVLGSLTGVLFVAATAIFRRRELATYSGQ
jgi:hypothetical protein